MWSLGCVAVEVLSRRPLFGAKTSHDCAAHYLKQHLSRLGTPGYEFLGLLETFEGLPCDKDLLLNAPKDMLPNQELLDLRPRHMADFVRQCLQWDPRLRMKAASGHCASVPVCTPQPRQDGNNRGGSTRTRLHLFGIPRGRIAVLSPELSQLGGIAR